MDNLPVNEYVKSKRKALGLSTPLCTTKPIWNIKMPNR